MDDCPSGEVQRFDARIGIEWAAHKPVGRPDHVGQREVHGEHPEPDEQHNGGELHPLRDGANDERRGDDGECQLKDRPHVIRNPIAALAYFATVDTFKEGEIQASKEGRARRKG
jgi:hypothetical protein